MKKYLYILIALFYSFSACTDSNEIEIVQQKDVTFNVNIANAYESYGLRSYQNFLGNNKTWSVGILSYIYDEKGNLTQKVVTTAKTFQTVTQNIGKLKAGNYEVVTLVTMISDEDNESSAWDIVDDEKLSTLMIKFKETRSIARWYEAIGLANTSIKIGENSNVSIIPKPIGCLVDVEYENFGSSHYNYLGFESRNIAIGLRLAPNLPATDRYYTDEYSQSNLWGSIGYFYDDGDELESNDSNTFYTFETGNRPYLFGVSKSMGIDGNNLFDFDVTGNYNFEDGKLYQAFAYYVGYPEILKTFVGTMTEFNSWYNNLDKTSNPIFAEPCTSWGNTVSYVKSYMKDTHMEQDITAGDYFYYMDYWGNYCESLIEYQFETEISGLENVFIIIYEEDAPVADVENQLIQYGYRYEGYVDADGEYLGYQLYSKDDTLVGLFEGIKSEYGTYTMMQFVSNEDDETRGTSSTRGIGGNKKILITKPKPRAFIATLNRYNYK